LQVTGPLELLLEAAAAGAAGAAAAGAAAAAAGAAGAAADAAVADLLMPPWPLQAPRPPCGEVVPSLHVTGPLELLLAAGVVAACASETAGAAASAAAHSAPHTKPLSFARFMSRSPL
jgi:hypothetical protein